MPRPFLILAVAVVVLILLLCGFAALDHEVPVTHVERPLGNAAAQ